MKIMNIKRLLSAVISAILFTFSACNAKSARSDHYEDMTKTQYVSILHDKKFEQGFLVRGLGAPIYGDDIEYFGDMYDPFVFFTYEKKGLEPKWNICQWASRYPFHDKDNTTDPFNYRFTEEGGGKYLYENRSKTVEVDTSAGEIRLKLDANECYKYPRTAGQEWPHLLLEQTMSLASAPDKNARICTARSVRAKLNVKMNDFIDYMGDTADGSLHSAMLIFYFFVSNLDPETKTFSDMLWFGMPIFDNRYAYTAEASFPDSGSKGSATEKWIFNISSTEFFDPDNNLYDPTGKTILKGEWKTVDVELLSLLKKGFESAQRAGYMARSRWENLYINGMYIGFELPGTYMLDMSIKNLDILLGQEEK